MADNGGGLRIVIPECGYRQPGLCLIVDIVSICLEDLTFVKSLWAD